jgi:hypothetical protein
MFVSEDRTAAQILFSVGHLSLDDQGRLLDELPAVHEAAAEHDTGADDGANRHGEAFGRAVTARSGQGSRAHPLGRNLASVLDGPEATPEVFPMSNEGRAVSTPLDS